MHTTVIDNWVDLQALVEQSRNVQMTQAQAEEQRQSFVFGNCHLSNDLVTRAMVAEADRRVTAERELEQVHDA